MADGRFGGPWRETGWTLCGLLSLEFVLGSELFWICLKPFPSRRNLGGAMGSLQGPFRMILAYSYALQISGSVASLKDPCTQILVCLVTGLRMSICWQVALLTAVLEIGAYSVLPDLPDVCTCRVFPEP